MTLRFPGLLLIFMIGNVALIVPAASQTSPKKPDPIKLACGQTMLVDDQTCPANEIQQVTGGCYNSGLSAPDGTRPKGDQYKCVKRK
jgi:hypothetical protein